MAFEFKKVETEKERKINRIFCLYYLRTKVASGARWYTPCDFTQNTNIVRHQTNFAKINKLTLTK